MRNQNFGIEIEMTGLTRAAAAQIIAGFLHDAHQRTLDTVENTADQARPKLDRERRARAFHRLAWAEAARLLIHLDIGPVSVHLDDLAD